VYAIQLAIAPVFRLPGIGAAIALICGLTIFLGKGCLATHAGRFGTRRIAR
jgi:hypothetical protein